MCTKSVTQLYSYLHMSPHIYLSVDVIFFSLTIFPCIHPIPNLVEFLVFDKMEEPTPRKTHNNIQNLCQKKQIFPITWKKLLLMFIILRKTPHLFQHYSPHTERKTKWKSTKEGFQQQHPKNLILPTLQSLILHPLLAMSVIAKRYDLFP